MTGKKTGKTTGNNRTAPKCPDEKKQWGILTGDPWLTPYAESIDRRMALYHEKRDQLLKDARDLTEFANGYLYFGIHRTDSGWTVREWLPGAAEVHLIGDFNGWNRCSHPLTRKNDGVWEITLEGRSALSHRQHIKLLVRHGDMAEERLPAYIRRAEADPETGRLCGIVWEPDSPFSWTDDAFRNRKNKEAPLIYEAHIGMAQEYEGIGTYREFADQNLERIAGLGYNTVQLMAVQEHPYYGSFGYQVSNFYAASHWYGEPDDLKYLINKAHGLGLRVLLDVVHSHACPNRGEGLELQDGTDCQYFLTGMEGIHPAWKTRLFNYDRQEVLHFLLSNLKFWLDEYHFDGFRFDGVTSMLYHSHGLERCYTDYSMYFGPDTDDRAVTYLMLANELIHEVCPQAMTVAEEMSGMPGIALPVREGGIGFDYRLAMGQPDHWIKLLKDQQDENWDMGLLWHEMTSHRSGEKDIAYCESHDQALVGDKTIMFRMADAEMYTGMDRVCHSPAMDRAVALHKMIRFLTLTAGGQGYLNFMGNEFGHPEWIDFPREGNGWSHRYARRQWSLAENGYLKYSWLNEFDRAMIRLCRDKDWLSDAAPCSLWIDQERKILSFSRGGCIFVFSFHPDWSVPDFFVHTHSVGGGRWRVAFSTDEGRFGGLDRVDPNYVYLSEETESGGIGFRIYLPARTAMMLEPVTGSVLF